MADQLITGTTLVEKESRSVGDVPVGGVIAWLKTFSGVPNLAEGWVECDGSVIVDSQSSLNGQTLPDLNGDNRFLRGKSTSGGTGGSETHTHAPLDSTAGALASGGFSYATFMTTPPSTSTLPTYYEVVWIMRVR